MRKFCAAVIVAAGTASRMRGIDKILEPIAGVPLIVRTVRAIERSECFDEIVVVTRKDLIGQIAELCPNATVIEGGDSRAHSVLCGLKAVPPQTEFVAVHDGARPLVTTVIIRETMQKALQCGAAAPAVAVHDTIKVANNGIVINTPDRSTLFAVQTPQIFKKEKLISSLNCAIEQGIALTDDCSALEAMGMEVALTEGSVENIKITTPIDLVLAEAILKRRNEE